MMVYLCGDTLPWQELSLKGNMAKDSEEYFSLVGRMKLNSPIQTICQHSKWLLPFFEAAYDLEFD